MSDALVQAIERLVTLFVIAGIGAVIANITLLNGVLTPTEQLFVPVFVAVLDAILKFIGGATVTVGSAAILSDDADRGHWWAV